jgi:hypothetical protein
MTMNGDNEWYNKFLCQLEPYFMVISKDAFHNDVFYLLKNNVENDDESLNLYEHFVHLVDFMVCLAANAHCNYCKTKDATKIHQKMMNQLGEVKNFFSSIFSVTVSFSICFYQDVYNIF